MVVASNGSSPLVYSNGTKVPQSTLSSDSVVNVEKGDPMIFSPYWEKMNDECTVVIKAQELMSYVCDENSLCFYMLPQMRDAILRIHNVVGNAVTKDNYIVLGTGSSQLYHAALYALSPSQPPNHPINVVAAAPYYSEYPDATEVLQSRLFKWSGDANTYNKNEPYIELVTSPNNPDGAMRTPVVKSKAQGKIIYDLAYYWPQFTPITHQLNHDLMLFTLSKSTGHAGSRIGWAIVKDIEVAKNMIKFMRLSSVGVSRESQIRATKLLEVICDSYQNLKSIKSELFFSHSKRLMKERWEKFKGVIEQSNVFTLVKNPIAYCNFTKETSESYPAFAWLKSAEGIKDGEKYLEKFNICTRGGERFGVDAKYVRISMISTDGEFNELLRRLLKVKRG
ncbi:tryptophan aminotransferase-related protein 1-like [Cicer arietinum]|uniref:Tryptophan aminotransferase-related protein 1-like n=1 Tax=Cicer arietinum TaxID=3827 RepID=A0A3Q7X2Q9_CICAR|nr:tryptophan aminotransferase-related protein 1-like [Cicer arietinum]